MLSASAAKVRDERVSYVANWYEVGYKDGFPCSICLDAERRTIVEFAHKRGGLEAACPMHTISPNCPTCSPR
eukprot:COSAG02_NODE_2489_length_8698_cov_6.406443_6_plen_72_part_00